LFLKTSTKLALLFLGVVAAVLTMLMAAAGVAGDLRLGLWMLFPVKCCPQSQ
jgi:hypothetical protein